MKLVLGIVILASLSANCSAATCTYYRSSNSITCGGVTCNTQGNVGGAGILPAGYYYISTFRINENIGNTPWFNLYKQKSDGSGFWDYYSDIPEENCRGRFGLHPGRISEGCVTVLSSSCFNQLKQVINEYPNILFQVSKCYPYTCWFGWCVSREVTVPCTTDLQVY